jgi:hypothetical protein
MNGKLLSCSIIYVTALVLAGCGVLTGFQPQPEWNMSQETPIIIARNCCGFVTQTYATNHIFDAQIWGDGRIIYSSIFDTGVRFVRTAQLSTTRVQSLLREIIDDGFFQMEDNYGEYAIADASEQCLVVHLVQKSKTVCQYVRGAPPEFEELYMKVWSVAWGRSEPYEPKVAYLESQLLDFSNFPGLMPHREWSETDSGISLASATSGLCIEGLALEQAWNIVNQDMWVGLVSQDRDIYQITLQISGVSMIAPPTPCVE